MPETLSSHQMSDLVRAARCLRCGGEDANADSGGWSSCFTVCDDCWGKPIDDGRRTLVACADKVEASE